jgi:polysaccharide export outer membrane protein
MMWSWGMQSVGLISTLAVCTLPLAERGTAQGTTSERPAATETLQPAAAAAAAAPFAEYRIRPGDRLRMSVWGEPNLTTDAVVMTHGVVSFPLVGEMSVADKTVSALAEELREAYLRYYQDPRVSLSAIPAVWPKVYVQGNVKQPGPVDYAPERRLLDYVGLAGGFALGADLANVAVVSSESDTAATVRVSMNLASSDGASAPNPPLKPGDTIWIGKALPVSVVGAVQSPGAVEYREGLRLSDYIGMAGGPTNRARVHDAVLKHTDSAGSSAVRRVDIATALQQPDDPQLNPVLAPGDVVTVPEHFLAGTLEWSDVLRAVAGIVFWR